MDERQTIVPAASVVLIPWPVEIEDGPQKFATRAERDGRRLTMMPRAFLPAPSGCRVLLPFSTNLDLRFSYRGKDVARMLDQTSAIVGDPDRSGFWVRLTRPRSNAYQNNVVLEFSRPGKPTRNAFIEAFEGRFRAVRTPESGSDGATVSPSAAIRCNCRLETPSSSHAPGARLGCRRAHCSMQIAGSSADRHAPRDANVLTGERHLQNEN